MNERQIVARFTRMEDGTREEYRLLEQLYEPFARALPDRVLVHLRQLAGSSGGMRVDRLTHCLQTATRAQRDGRDDEYVVCALLHDLGDLLAPHNHADLAAAILRPFVSERNLWMVAQHPVFQGYYFWHHIGADRNAREKYRDHPHFEFTAEFCARYDQCSFDPDYDTLPLEHFEPLLRRVLREPRWSELEA
ncbi:MAG: HD domain-containing protein [Myxococcales bacterium]|nr:HD domain-containing protein [Myxococcales bacterium]MDH5566309.1 HD domain-containing protein [Myxococcales bacterium]